MDLFESSTEWYEAYREENASLDDTAFDSFDEYWEIEMENQEQHKMEMLREILGGNNLFRPYNQDEPYNKAIAELIIQEFEAILKKHSLRFWTDIYGDVYCK